MKEHMNPIEIGFQAIENALCMFALRDEFAAKAMHGFLSSYPEGDITNPLIDIAHDAYTMADAMLIAREGEHK